MAVSENLLYAAAARAAPPVCAFRLILSGEVRCILGHSKAAHLRGPCLCIATQAHRIHGVQLLGRHSRLRLVGIDCLASEAADPLHINIQTIVRNFCFPLKEDCPLLLQNSPSRSLTTLAAQILACPLQGVTRDIYLAGMAFQFLALAMESVNTRRDDETIRVDGLSPRDIDRIDCVKIILRDRCQRPPPIAELARTVGLSPKRLTSLFRQECGIGISDFLQQHRFEQAFNLLVHSDLQIAEIAYRIGYTPAHFSTAFKKRFDRYPSELRGCAA